MKTCYYTCHVASHQKQPQPILGPNPHRSPHVHAASFICAQMQLLGINFRGGGSRTQSHKPQRSPLSLVPALYSYDHSECVRARISRCGFSFPPPKKLFKLIFLGIYRTCISLVCVLSHSWPISTAVSRTCFRFILADCKFCIQTPPPPPSISTLTWSLSY